MYNTEEELIILKELKGGCKIAFEKIYIFYQPMLYKFVLNWVKSEEITHEILQELFTQLWVSKYNIDIQKSFKSYIYKIAKNLIIDYFKSLSHNSAKMENFKKFYFEYAANSVDQFINYKEANRQILEVLKKVPIKCREVYILCKLEGYSYEEVSKLLNISIPTINNHIVKANKIIKSNWISVICVFYYFF